VSQADPTVCPHESCGHSNLPGAQFCATCGRPIGSISRRPARAARWSWLIPIAAVAALYYPALNGELVWDDGIVQKDQMVAFRSLHDVFFPPRGIPQWGTSYYRPMVTLTYLLDQALFGRGAARGPLAAVVLYHLIATFFVWLLARQVLRQLRWAEWGAVAAGVVFAVHPIHTESVCWITGRSDTVAAMFFLPAVVTALHYRDRGARWTLIVSPALYLCAVLSKEVALSALLVVPLMLWLVPRAPDSAGTVTAPRRRWSAAGGWVPLGVLYLVATALYASLRAAGASARTGALNWEWGALLQRAGAAVTYYLIKIVVPPPQSAYPTHLPGTLTVAIAITVAVLLLVAGVWLYRRGKPLLLIAVGWVLLTLAPSLAIAVRQISETPVAERYLYLPSAGLCLLVGGLLGAAWSRRIWRVPSLVLLVGLVGVYSFWARGRVDVWQDNIVLWTDVTSKDAAGLPWHTLGQAYLKRDQDAKAMECFDKALETYKSSEGRALAWNSKGAILMKTNPAEAAKAFQKSYQERPSYATPYFNLGLLGLNQADKDFGAKKVYNPDLLSRTRAFFAKAIECNPHYTWAYLGLGKCQSRIAAVHLMAKDNARGREALLAARQSLETVCKLDGNGRFGKEAAPLLAEVNKQLEKIPP
jgi:tetratricopeptide (TPR) repeat protein